ncbi:MULTISPECIES: ABC transporter ATP-binding protein [Proteus]|uniref:ABC transporter ATP-binding protein n=1 Tax=Proteus TaxID=583 RepID=UPI000D696565|nr:MULTISPECIES: ABC transporter ATP-binding protein [Proteus]MCO8051680.1 ABC transporter ATP-binding protein [Proteus penneri]MCX2589236.1 ABC transporter ATP-binding protein [Proteus penneri]NBL77634.1 ATP-binding cassette domain-containing protein [Proteus sp. G2672]NBL89660.1 ATP-binding cassette domain-containing protein [Proteus sp. G2673]NBM01955.1 ATP-binding cassette domain-containing protein [Proteus sp. G2671]
MIIANANRLSIGYKGKSLIKDLSFRIEQGQIICLLGANGCGKTTLMRTLLGLIPCIDGEINIAGKTLSEWSPTELAKVVAYVPQATHIPFSFNVIDMVVMGRGAHLSFFSMPSSQDKTMAMETLEMLSLSHLAHRTFDTLSGGEKQMVLIARALVQQPKLLIMDEPAASLDFGNQIKLLTQVKALKALGISVFMSTHHPQHAASLADDVILLTPHVPVLQDRPDILLTPDNLAHLYGVQPTDIQAHFHAYSDNKNDHRQEYEHN